MIQIGEDENQMVEVGEINILKKIMVILYFLIFCIFIYFLFIKKYYSKEKEKYFREKRDITRVYSSFLSDIFVDKNDNFINSKNIENIEKNIINFIKRVEKIQGIYLYLQNNINSLEEKEIIFIEKKWILEFSLWFVKKLDDWLVFHKKELFNLVKKLEKQSEKTKIENFKWNLLLHKKLIENQINEIQKFK